MHRLCDGGGAGYQRATVQISKIIIEVIDNNTLADFGDAGEHVVDVGVQDVLCGGDAGGTSGRDISGAENGEEEEEDDHDD